MDFSAPSSLKSPNFTPVEGIQLRFDVTASDLEALTDELIQRSKFVYDSIVNLPSESCTFKKVFEVLGHLETWMYTYSSIVTMPQHVHTNKELREKSSELEQKLSEFEIETSMRLDLFTKLKEAASKCENDPELTEEDKRFINKVLLEFKRKGLELEEDKREILKKNLTRLSELSIAFAKTIAEDDTTILLTKEELAGMPEDYLNRLEKKEESGTTKFVVTMKYPDVIPLMENATDSSTRQRVEFAFHSRCASNIDLLEEALKLRKINANILGYKTHADFQLELKMAKNKDRVSKFLDDLKGTLMEYGKLELPRLLEIKKSVEPNTKDIFSYDLSFTQNLLLKKYFNVDHLKIKEYYPLNSVTEKMLKIYEDVLNLKFDIISDPQPWNLINPEDVQLIKVSDGDSSEVLGYFYLDLFPRTGKYSHAACFPIQPGSLLENGKRQLPVAAMVANFTKPTPDQPTLLRHDELVTYFHELGHVMHTLCSKTKFARFHGTSVEGDFVEAPSQMLENWCWDSKMLKKLASLNSKGEEIDSQLIEDLLRSKNAGKGLAYLRQLCFATFDLQIHSLETDTIPSINELFLKLRKEITLVPSQPNTCFVATFGHLMGGYDAGYYGYLYSEVFSADMFESYFKKLPDISAKKAGVKYRENILKPGGSKDADQMLRDFLGRDPEIRPFLDSITPPKI